MHKFLRQATATAGLSPSSPSKPPAVQTAERLFNQFIGVQVDAADAAQDCLSQLVEALCGRPIPLSQVEPRLAKSFVDKLLTSVLVPSIHKALDHHAVDALRPTRSGHQPLAWSALRIISALTSAPELAASIVQADIPALAVKLLSRLDLSAPGDEDLALHLTQVLCGLHGSAMMPAINNLQAQDELQQLLLLGATPVGHHAVQLVTVLFSCCPSLPPTVIKYLQDRGVVTALLAQLLSCDAQHVQAVLSNLMCVVTKSLEPGGLLAAFEQNRGYQALADLGVRLTSLRLTATTDKDVVAVPFDAYLDRVCALATAALPPPSPAFSTRSTQPPVESMTPAPDGAGHRRASSSFMSRAGSWFRLPDQKSDEPSKPAAPGDPDDAWMAAAEAPRVSGEDDRGRVTNPKAVQVLGDLFVALLKCTVPPSELPAPAAPPSADEFESMPDALPTAESIISTNTAGGALAGTGDSHMGIDVDGEIEDVADMDDVDQPQGPSPHDVLRDTVLAATARDGPGQVFRNLHDLQAAVLHRIGAIFVADVANFDSLQRSQILARIADCLPMLELPLARHFMHILEELCEKTSVVPMAEIAVLGRHLSEATLSPDAAAAVLYAAANIIRCNPALYQPAFARTGWLDMGVSLLQRRAKGAHMLRSGSLWQETNVGPIEPWNRQHLDRMLYDMLVRGILVQSSQTHMRIVCKLIGARHVSLQQPSFGATRGLWGTVLFADGAAAAAQASAVMDTGRHAPESDSAALSDDALDAFGMCMAQLLVSNMPNIELFGSSGGIPALAALMYDEVARSAALQVVLAVATSHREATVPAESMESDPMAIIVAANHGARLSSIYSIVARAIAGYASALLDDQSSTESTLGVLAALTSTLEWLCTAVRPPPMPGIAPALLAAQLGPSQMALQEAGGIGVCVGVLLAIAHVADRFLGVSPLVEGQVRSSCILCTCAALRTLEAVTFQHPANRNLFETNRGFEVLADCMRRLAPMVIPDDLPADPSPFIPSALLLLDALMGLAIDIPMPGEGKPPPSIASYTSTPSIVDPAHPQPASPPVPPKRSSRVLELVSDGASAAAPNAAELFGFGDRWAWLPSWTVQIHAAAPIAVLAELIALWTPPLSTAVASTLFTFLVRACDHGNNRAVLADAGMAGVILQNYAVGVCGVTLPTSLVEHAKFALTFMFHPLQQPMHQFLSCVAAYRISPPELRLWLRLLRLQGLNMHTPPPLLDALVNVSCESRYIPANLFEGVPVLHMDLQMTGVAGARIPSLQPNLSGIGGNAASSKLWPPANGYTFLCWLRITRFQPDRHLHPHISLLQITSSEGVDVDIRVEGGMVWLVTAKTRTQFPEFHLEANRWYHLGVTHSKSLLGQSSATLYVNGLESRTIRIPFIRSGAGGGAVGYIGHPADTGPPQQCGLRWDLGPTYLVDDVMAAEAVNTVFAAGPCYDGDFHGTDGNGTVPVIRDLLNVKNIELLAKWKDKSRSGPSVLRQRGGRPRRSSIGLPSTAAVVTELAPQDELVSEDVISLPSLSDKIILALSASRAVSEPGTLGSPPVTHLFSQSHSGLVSAYLEGGAVAQCPRRVATTVGALCNGGVVVGLGLFAAAASPQAVQNTARLLVSWLLSEPANLAAMAQVNGYVIFSHLLRQKAVEGMVDVPILQVVLALCGLNDASFVPETSISALLAEDLHKNRTSSTPMVAADQCISNRAACQHLLLNFDIWACTDPKVQSAVLRCLYVCITTSRSGQKDVNRECLRSLGLVRYLLFFMAHPQAVDALNDAADVLLAMLFDGKTAPSYDELQQLVDFITTTMSRNFVQRVAQMSAFNLASTGSVAPPSALGVSISGTGAAVGGGAERSGLRIRSRAESAPTVSVTSSTQTPSQFAQTVRNVCLRVLVRLACQLPIRSATTNNANSAMCAPLARACNPDWIFFVVHETVSVSSVIEGMRLLTAVFPLYVVKFKKIQGFRKLARWLPSFDWATDTGANARGPGMSPAAQIFCILLCMMWGREMSSFSNATECRWKLASLEDFLKPSILAADAAGAVPQPHVMRTLLTCLRRSFELHHHRHVYGGSKTTIQRMNSSGSNPLLAETLVALFIRLFETSTAFQALCVMGDSPDVMLAAVAHVIFASSRAAAAAYIGKSKQEAAPTGRPRSNTGSAGLPAFITPSQSNVSAASEEELEMASRGSPMSSEAPIEVGHARTASAEESDPDEASGNGLVRDNSSLSLNSNGSGEGAAEVTFPEHYPFHLTVSQQLLDFLSMILIQSMAQRVRGLSLFDLVLSRAPVLEAGDVLTESAGVEFQVQLTRRIMAGVLKAIDGIKLSDSKYSKLAANVSKLSSYLVDKLIELQIELPAAAPNECRPTPPPPETSYFAEGPAFLMRWLFAVRNAFPTDTGRRTGGLFASLTMTLTRNRESELLAVPVMDSIQRLLLYILSSDSTAPEAQVSEILDLVSSNMPLWLPPEDKDKERDTEFTAALVYRLLRLMDQPNPAWKSIAVNMLAYVVNFRKTTLLRVMRSNGIAPEVVPTGVAAAAAGVGAVFGNATGIDTSGGANAVLNPSEPPIDLFKDGFELLLNKRDSAGSATEALTVPEEEFFKWLGTLNVHERGRLHGSFGQIWLGIWNNLRETNVAAWKGHRRRWRAVGKKVIRNDAVKAHEWAAAASARKSAMTQVQAVEDRRQLILLQEHTDRREYGRRTWVGLSRHLFEEGGVWGIARAGGEMVSVITRAASGTGLVQLPLSSAMGNNRRGGGQGGDWYLDAAEGPFRMRKKLTRGRGVLLLSQNGALDAEQDGGLASPKHRLLSEPSIRLRGLMLAALLARRTSSRLRGASMFSPNRVSPNIVPAEAPATPVASDTDNAGPGTPLDTLPAPAQSSTEGESKDAAAADATAEVALSVSTVARVKAAAVTGEPVNNAGEPGAAGGATGGAGAAGGATGGAGAATAVSPASGAPAPETPASKARVDSGGDADELGAFDDDVDDDDEGEAETKGGDAGSVSRGADSPVPDSHSNTEVQAEDEDDERDVFDDGAPAVDEKLRPLLEPGDRIESLYQGGRVNGMDTVDGIVMFGTTNLYVVDGFRLADGKEIGDESEEVEDISHRPVVIPKRPAAILQVPLESPRVSLQKRFHQWSGGTTLTGGAGGSGGALELSGSSVSADDREDDTGHSVQFFAFSNLRSVYKRRYLLRHVALELFDGSGRTCLLTLGSTATRDKLYMDLLRKCPIVRMEVTGANQLSWLSGADPAAALTKSSLKSAQTAWMDGHLTNFEYLMVLNTLAGRSFNDFTQYPVFPWVLADYTSETLDLSNPATFRDLSKPMGALSKRADEFKTRYEVMVEQDDPDMVPFHYGTHYSSPAVVVGYLLRLQPFASAHLDLQQGEFDKPDRLFRSIYEKWTLSSGLNYNTHDVSELTPEFYYLPQFLENRNRYPLGTTQSGVAVDDVVLPPWAKGSAREFVRLHRAALESDFVSLHLCQWIDLIFGYRQQGSEAVEAMNVYHHLTYEGAVDLDAPENIDSRKLYVDMIHAFGQTPSQLFQRPHPARRIGSDGTFLDRGAAGVMPVRALAAAFVPQVRTDGADVADAEGPSTLDSELDATQVVEVMSPNDEALGLSGTPDVDRQAAVSPSSDGPMSPMPPSRSRVTSESPAGMDAAGMLSTMTSPRLQPTRSMMGFAGLWEDSKDITEAPVRALVVRTAPASSPLAPFSYVRLESLKRCDSVGQIVVSGDRWMVLPAGCCMVEPAGDNGRGLVNSWPTGAIYMAWGFCDLSLRFFSAGSVEGGSGETRLVDVRERLHVGPVGCACVSTDGCVAATGGSEDTVIRIWAVQNSGSSPSLRLRASLSGHLGGVTKLAMSNSYAALISASLDGTVILWDLHRLQYVRTLLDAPMPFPVTALWIDSRTGMILVAACRLLVVCDVNGEALAAAMAPSNITACELAPSEEWWDTLTVVTGHESGEVRLWGLRYPTASARDTRVDFGVDAHTEQTVPAHLRRQSSSVSFYTDAPTEELLDADTKRLLSGMDMSTVCLSLRLRAALQWHTTSVTAVHVDRKQRLYSGDASGKAVMWAHV